MSTPRQKKVLQPSAEIRLATPDDAAAISALLFEAFSTARSGYTDEAFAEVTPSAKKVAARFEEGPQWVAMADGRMVGTVSVMPQPDHLYIRSVGVAPDARGLGIAKRLMMTVEDFARAEGFDRLFLYTTYFSQGAIELYEKLGYVRGRDTTAEEWFGTPGLAMDKKLGTGNKQNVARS